MEKQSNAATAWKEALKGNFGNAVKALSTSHPLIPSAYRSDGMTFFGRSEIFFKWSGPDSSLKAYNYCPEFQSIVNKRAEAHGNGRRWIMRTEGKGKGKEDNSEFARKCKARLENPNPFQTGTLFEAQMKIYIDVFGWCLILPIYGAESYAKVGLSECSAMYLIPPYMLSWEEHGNWRYGQKIPDVIKKLTLTVQGKPEDLNLEQVVIIKDILPRMQDGNGCGRMGENLIFPESRVKAQERPINNIIAAYDSRGELISYAGSQGLVSPDAKQFAGQYVPVAKTPEEEKAVEDKFKTKYGIRSRQNRYIFSHMSLTFQQMGRPTKDLMLFEEIVDDVKALSIAWNYPFPLLGYGSSSLNGTEVDAFTRNLYQDSIIPEAASIDAQLGKAFKVHENGCVFEKDYSHVPALQENEQEKAQVRQTMGMAVNNDFKNGFIKYNRALELLGEDTIGTAGDVYYAEWVKTNGTQNNPNGNTGQDTSNAGQTTATS